MAARAGVVGEQHLHGSWLWYSAWVGVGAGLSLGVVGILSIGVIVLPVAIVLAVFVGTRSGSSRGAAGLLSGLSLPIFYIAWLNREGPGDVCWTTTTGGGCKEEYSPWPFLVIGLLLVVSSVLLQWRTAHR